MARSEQLRAADLHSIAEIAEECRDLGDDVHHWRPHLFARAGTALGAGLVLGGELSMAGGRPVSLGTSEWGWHHGYHRAGWVRSCEKLRDDPHHSVLFRGYFPRHAETDGIALSRPQIIKDCDWYSTEYYESIHESIGIDNALVCFCALPGAPTILDGIILGRAPRERDFTHRQRLYLGALYRAVTRWVGGPLARFAEPAPSSLPPRVRHVLQALLDGDADKQIALRLHLQPHTVNQYVKRIFDHFGVKSRTELMARWVRRGWGARAAWAD